MTASGFTLRFVSHDWPRFPEITDLRYEILQAPFGVVRDDSWNDEDPAYRHLVAIAEDGTVVGYAQLIVHDEDAQIRQVAVGEAWQRLGVGSQLIATLVRRADEEHATQIWLNARVPAIGFYERLGFEAVGGTFNTGRTSLPHRRMEYRPLVE